jgi:hypothetical protein
MLFVILLLMLFESRTKQTDCPIDIFSQNMKIILKPEYSMIISFSWASIFAFLKKNTFLGSSFPKRGIRFPGWHMWIYPTTNCTSETKVSIFIGASLNMLSRIKA